MNIILKHRSEYTIIIKRHRIIKKVKFSQKSDHVRNREMVIRRGIRDPVLGHE